MPIEILTMRLRKYLSTVGSLSDFASGKVGLNFKIDSVISAASEKTHNSEGSEANSETLVKVYLSS
jgi:hypothetical protein